VPYSSCNVAFVDSVISVVKVDYRSKKKEQRNGKLCNKKGGQIINLREGRTLHRPSLNLIIKKCLRMHQKQSERA